MMKVLFVCSGNQCRSPFASAVLRKMLAQEGIEGIEVSSAGTVAMDWEPASGDALEVAGQMGIDLSGHSARRVNVELLRDADKIAVMEEIHRQSVLGLCPEIEGRIILLGSFAPTITYGDEIPDPIGQSHMAYRTCFSRIIEAANGLLSYLLEEKKREQGGAAEGDG